MNKVKKGLIGIVLPGILAFYGCGLSGRIGGYEPVNLSESHYASDIKNKADKLAKNNTKKAKKQVIDAYGSLGLMDPMDKNIRWLINEDLETGMMYSERGDKYHRMHE